MTFKTNTVFPFRCETHIQQGINIGLKCKQCCQSLVTLACRLGGVVLACKTLTQAPARNYWSPFHPAA